MPDSVYIVEYITRAHSSGSENKYRELFKSIDDASKCMINIFEDFCIENGFDEDDLFTNEDMEEEAPKQTMELAQELFNPEALKTFLKLPQFLGIPNTIYGPYSQFCCHVPFEMFFSHETIN